MAFSHGKSLVFKTDNSEGSLTDISAYVTKVDFPLKADKHDLTTAGKNSRVKLGGLKDATIRVEGKFDATLNTIMFNIIGEVGSFEYGPAGSAEGAPKFTGEALCVGYSPPAAVDKENTWTADFEVSDDVTLGTYSA